MGAVDVDQIATKETLFGVLYALNYSGYWSAKQFSAWSTEVLMSSDDPAVWILDLIAAKDQAALDQAIGIMFNDSNMLVPSWVHDLTGGLILLRNAKGLLSDSLAISRLGDLADACGICGLDPGDFYFGFRLDDVRLREAHLKALAFSSEMEERPIPEAVLTAAL